MPQQNSRDLQRHGDSGTSPLPGTLRVQEHTCRWPSCTSSTPDEPPATINPTTHNQPFTKGSSPRKGISELPCREAAAAEVSL